MAVAGIPAPATLNPVGTGDGMTRGRRLTARAGLDRNSLRRRTDKIAAYGALGLLIAFLAGAPVLAVSAGHWAYRASVNEQRDQRSWHEVTAVLLQQAPVGSGNYSMSGSWTLARWRFPAGHNREGMIPVAAGALAGSHVRIWVDAAGRPAGPRLSLPMVASRVAVAVVTTILVVAAVLAGVASFSRWLLDRRRLAGWEAEWNSVGPRWTRQFWAPE
jgi:hypothetical protein